MIKASGFLGEIITNCCQADSNENITLCEMFFKQLNQSIKPEHFWGHLSAVYFYYIPTWEPSTYSLSQLLCLALLWWTQGNWEISDSKMDIACGFLR